VETGNGGPPIELQELTYEVGGQRILEDISFQVRHGEILSVLGMSGSGKSTLLRNIIGLAQPTHGDVRIYGRSIVGLGERALNEVRLRMGMVFQNAALFDSMTVAENVAFGLRRRKKLKLEALAEKVSEKLELVGLAGTEKLMPAELSGGMRKRVGIARALALEPDIMLYDEPSSGLDPVMADVIDDVIRQLRDRLQVTSVLVSHHVANVLRLADRVLLLYDKRVAASGTPEEFRDSEDPLVRQFVEGRAQGPMTG